MNMYMFMTEQAGLSCTCSEITEESVSADVTHLRNEFNFWDVHGIMNTSGFL